MVRIENLTSRFIPDLLDPERSTLAVFARAIINYTSNPFETKSRISPVDIPFGLDDLLEPLCPSSLTSQERGRFYDGHNSAIALMRNRLELLVEIGVLEEIDCSSFPIDSWGSKIYTILGLDV